MDAIKVNPENLVAYTVRPGARARSQNFQELKTRGCQSLRTARAEISPVLTCPEVVSSPEN